ncbi:MAG: lipopolysaccharide heptosyltransferase II [Chloroflexi bacterium]|nr:lipopolysaccharide heptosyltransferase II [Chloroflexota bacterium]
MDKETLARRNLEVARTLHQPSAPHAVRDLFLSGLATLPIPPRRARSNRVLVIRPDHLGDVLLMTPALQFIKRERPETELHVICGAWAADVLARYDEVDVVLTLDFPGFQRQGRSRRGNPYLRAIDSARMLRRIGYDSALIMRPDHWWGAMLAFLAGIEERIGYDNANVAPFLTGRSPHQYEHAVLQNLHLAQFWLGAPHNRDIELNLTVDPADAAAVDQLLADRGIDVATPIICIHPGAGMPSKLWQSDKWAEVADQVARRHNVTIIFTGSSPEQAVIEDIAGGMTAASCSVAGETSAGQLAALYRRARAVLGPDSGAMHVAAAVHTPTVTLFGPADPIEFAPWGDRRKHAAITSTIACRPCRILDWRDDSLAYHPCVRDISVCQVLEALQRVSGAEAPTVSARIL